MNILFLTLLDFKSLRNRNIYTDLLREFVNYGHNVYVISPVERRNGIDTHVIKEENAIILKLKIGNTQKTNIIEKGISTITIESRFISGIKKYFDSIRFDLVLYSTPPITFCNAINYIKKRDKAATYLLLKDIFPQNAVDLGMLSKKGIKGFLYRYFRKKEKKLYKISDRIGCMSQANLDYVLKNNPEIPSEKVEICPNCIEIIDKSVDGFERNMIREKYNIPLNKTVLVYGGNLGKPQGIHFLIECVNSQRMNDDVFFLIVGGGTEFPMLEQFVNQSMQNNVRLMKQIPKDDYDTLVGACDIGMIFLDYNFTIPNFPSRLLSYMQAKVPVLAVTDINTDIGKIIVDGGFGWWCESNDVGAFCRCVNECLKQIRDDYIAIKEREYAYLQEHYDVKHYVSKIIDVV